jgi:hypothetical protein
MPSAETHLRTSGDSKNLLYRAFGSPKVLSDFERIVVGSPMNETPSEGRNLVLCFDGTNNEFGREPANAVSIHWIEPKQCRSEKHAHAISPIPLPSLRLLNV